MEELDSDPENAKPMTRLQAGYHYNGKPHHEVYIALLPTPDGTELPLYLKYGGWNACPESKVHTALARRWRKEYGAEIAVIASDIVEYTVTRPPATEEEALTLAWEH